MSATAARVLQPLSQVEAAVGALGTYASSDALAAALSDVRGATERTLRLLLRESRAAPDAARLSALSADYPVEDVITALRRAEVLSLELAGEIHALLAAAERAARGNVRASDGDVALQAVMRLRAEATAAVAREEGAVEGGREHAGTADQASAGAPRAADAQAAADAPGRRREPGGWLRWAAVGLMVLAATFFAVQLFRDAPDAMSEGVAAFREERFGVAEAAFRSVVADAPENVTAWLYLGRIARVQGRLDDAADALEQAATLDPDDTAVQRELGYLFMDLSRPAVAAERFDRARELDPENVASWIGFIRALRAAGDPAAEVWLERAPAEVKAVLGGTSPTTS
jgi:tetratricopeptide (TPR) repeat protein